jgi:hypothetical protein
MEPIDKSFELLGVDAGSTSTEIAEAYRTMLKVWHPDRFPNDVKLRKTAEQKTKEINRAFERLQNYSAPKQTPLPPVELATRTPSKPTQSETETKQSRVVPFREKPLKEKVFLVPALACIFLGGLVMGCTYLSALNGGAGEPAFTIAAITSGVGSILWIVSVLVRDY